MNHTSVPFRSRLGTLGIVTLMLIGGGNAADGNPHSKSGTQVVRLGREFKLKARHQVTLKREGLQIKFVELKEDSRCPADVKCVWAGNAAVRLEVSILGKGRRSVTLNTTGNSPAADYRGYQIQLVDVSPYPRSAHKIAPGDYVVTLLVKKS